MSFLIAEDDALKEVLKGMTVSDEKNAARPVGVWFGQPDPELRQQLFPFVTVNMVDLAEARERTMMAGGVSPWYYTPDPANMVVNGTTYDDWAMPLPVPVDITYQVTTFARQPRHDRQILSQILGNRLPLRFGSLVVKEKLTSVEADGTENWDGTVRRLDTLDVSKRDTVEDAKRLFMNAITIRISSEIPVAYIWELYKRVETINSGVGVYDPPRPTTEAPSFKETFTITIPTGTP